LIDTDHLGLKIIGRIESCSQPKSDEGERGCGNYFDGKKSTGLPVCSEALFAPGVRAPRVLSVFSSWRRKSL